MGGEAVLAGRSAVVVGASRGIGLAIAAELVEHGARVVITGRTPERLAAAVVTLGGENCAVGVTGDALDEGHREAVVGTCLDRWGRLDFLVNNVAVGGGQGPIIDADLEGIGRALDGNVVVPLAWTQTAWRAWMRDHGGSVVNMASIGGLRVVRGGGGYTVSKAALIHLTRQLALELAPAVRVNAVAPSIVLTEGTRAVYGGREEELVSVFPMQRLGTPQDIASTAVFLLSEGASWITGQTIVVDGGRLLNRDEAVRFIPG
jgi:NAD(P)-dependent dehydrogenase (short-subunit alcohol dehydrogenase family)